MLRPQLLVFLAGAALSWPAPVLAQQDYPLPLTGTSVTPSSLPARDTGSLAERLNALEQRLDILARQNEALLREKRQAEGRTTSTGEAGHPQGASRQDGASDGQQGGTRPTLGGGSGASGGGDPTTIGRAQEVGNQHLGKAGLAPTYDYDDGGLWLATKDKEFSFGLSGMTQLDGMLYGRPTPGLVPSSGFYNPRSRIYFQGHATKPISWEFSFQNFYDTASLLDAYVNFNYDERFQVRLGRFKNPFSYEFYRIHIWDLMAPERSIWANNFEANRRFGLMLHGVLLDQTVEYAVGSFDTQRNSLRPFNSRQDFQGFVNFKPFYNRDPGFLLRDLQFGGSVNLGNESQSPVPLVLRVNQSPGGAAADATATSNAASMPFLAFNPNVRERGGRAMWETHLAYYRGGLSFLSAIEGGHESYSNGPNARKVQVPVSGWFVQGGYILTGETIRDRTLLQPLSPFSPHKGEYGIGAWEVTARYSQLDLDSRVFTAGLADRRLWTNNVKSVDLGCNWYLNQFVKVYLDWEHVMFGDPVISTKGTSRHSGDLFWLRTQVYF